MGTTTPAASASGIRSRAPDPRMMRAINPFIAALLRSPCHRLLSGQTMLLSYTGRRSGRSFTLPVGYLADGQDLLVVSQHSEQKRWWRNLRGGAPVVLHLRGRDVTAQADVVEAPTAVAAEIQRLIAKLGAKEASARLYIDLNSETPRTREQLADALGGVVLIRITPLR